MLVFSHLTAMSSIPFTASEWHVDTIKAKPVHLINFPVLDFKSKIEEELKWQCRHSEQERADGIRAACSFALKHLGVSLTQMGLDLEQASNWEIIAPRFTWPLVVANVRLELNTIRSHGEIATDVTVVAKQVRATQLYWGVVIPGFTDLSKFDDMSWKFPFQTFDLGPIEVNWNNDSMRFIGNNW